MSTAIAPKVNCISNAPLFRGDAKSLTGAMMWAALVLGLPDRAPKPCRTLKHTT